MVFIPYVKVVLAKYKTDIFGICKTDWTFNPKWLTSCTSKTKVQVCAEI